MPRPSCTPLLAALLVTLVASFMVALAETTTKVDIFKERVQVSSANLPPVTLQLRTSTASFTFLQRAALTYSLYRSNEVIVQVSQEAVDAAATSEEKRAFDKLALGLYDAAFIARTMTAADRINQPDLLAFPLWATGFGPVYNLPEVSDSLVLTQFALAKIYAGVVTMWNDPIIQASNTFKLPAKPIELVLNAESKTYLTQFVNALRLADPTFPVAASVKPPWPTHLYAKFSRQLGVDGPPSYVLEHPYTLTMALVGVSTRLGAKVAAVVNNGGVVVRPTFISINAAMREKAVLATRKQGGSGSSFISYEWTGDLVSAPGKTSWPFTQAVSVFLPRSYSRQSCRARSERAKFIRWMFRTDEIRYTLAQTESATMLSEEMDAMLGFSTHFTEGQLCDQGDVRVNNGRFEPITVGGPSLLDTHVNLRLQQLEQYNAKDTVSTYQSVVMDEDTAMTKTALPGARPDVAWIMPQTFDHMWPGKLQQHSEKLTLVHMNILGVVPSFRLPAAVEALLVSIPGALPLKLGMEPLASIFLGDIATWTDAAIVADNPAVATAFAQTGSDPAITLVFFGKGSMADAAVTAVSNHLILALNVSAAFQQSGIRWTLPADWSPVAAKLTALGRPFVWVNIEADLEAAVSRIPGAIGYHLRYSNLPRPTTVFDMLMPIAFNPADPSDLTMVQVSPTPESFLACAVAATVSESAYFLIEASTSVDPTYRDCWPIPMLLSVALPNDVQAQADTSGAVTMADINQLCFRQKRVTGFAAWLASDEALIPTAKLVGRATLAENPKWRAGVLAQLDKVNCGGQPILWTPDIVWKLSSSVFNFGLASTAVGLFAVLVTALALIKYRQRTIIRSANIILQGTVLAGLALLFVTPLLFVSTPTVELCNAFAWLLCLGVSLSFTPVCMKIYKVHRAYQQRRKIKVRQMRSKTMYAAVAAMIALDVCLLASSQASGGLMQPATIRAFKNERVHTYFQCGVPSEMAGQAAALIGVKMTILIISCVQAFGVRSVSSAFNESANLSWALWSSVLSAAIIVPLIFLTGGVNSDVGVFLLVFLILWVGAGTLAFSFGHKFFTLLKEERAMRTSQLNSSKSGHTSLGSYSGTRSGETGASTFIMPSLDACNLSMLEKYICALEVQIASARERRRKEFGSASNVGSGAETHLVSGAHSKGASGASSSKVLVSNLSSVAQKPHPIKEEAKKRPLFLPSSDSPLQARRPVVASATASPMVAHSSIQSPSNANANAASMANSPALPAGSLIQPFVPVVDLLTPPSPRPLPPRAPSPMQLHQQQSPLMQHAPSPVRSPSPTGIPRQPLRIAGNRASLRANFAPSPRAPSPALLVEAVGSGSAAAPLPSASSHSHAHAARPSSRVPGYSPGSSPESPHSDPAQMDVDRISRRADSPY